MDITFPAAVLPGNICHEIFSAAFTGEMVRFFPFSTFRMAVPESPSTCFRTEAPPAAASFQLRNGFSALGAEHSLIL